VDAIMSRLSSISDSTGTLANYKYLGLGTIVVEDYEDIDVKLDYSRGGTYSGFDQFGRVVDQYWESYAGTPEAIDRYKYTYLWPGQLGDSEIFPFSGRRLGRGTGRCSVPHSSMAA
jgi:hypothetical protein